MKYKEVSLIIRLTSFALREAQFGKLFNKKKDTAKDSSAITDSSKENDNRAEKKGGANFSQKLLRYLAVPYKLKPYTFWDNKL